MDEIISVRKSYKNLVIAFLIVIIICYSLFNEVFCQNDCNSLLMLNKKNKLV